MAYPPSIAMLWLGLVLLVTVLATSSTAASPSTAIHDLKKALPLPQALQLRLLLDWWLGHLRSRRGLAVAMAALCGAVPYLCYCGWARKEQEDDADAMITPFRIDTKFTFSRNSYSSYTTPSHTYPRIRTWLHIHKKADLLPPKLPLLVFIHGLGGQVSQFQFLLDYFCKISHVLAIDLPGCGGSKLAPKTWDAYTTPALAELVEEIVRAKLDEHPEWRDYILVGHSMGCSIAATVAGKTSSDLYTRCAGFIALCPKATFTEQEVKKARFGTSLPTPVFNAFRYLDRRGGINSASVKRFVSPTSTLEVRQLQLEFNERSQTPTVLRMIRGFAPPPIEVWQAITCPILLLAGSHDHVTPSVNVEIISSYFSSLSPDPRRRLKSVVIPDCGHGVMYEKYHHVCHVMADFMSRYVRKELCLSWQLEELKEEKWILKNEEKWMKTPSVSGRVGGSMFKAMKTLRQDDPIHNPASFLESNPDVGHIVDISFGEPPYDPASFDGTHITYHKCSTKSKTPPSIDQVDRFISQIDSILPRPVTANSHSATTEPEGVIAVHCHYGYNRTGLFICGYLIERLGFGVQEALDAFKAARYPGIRHAHFIDELFVRYDRGTGGAGLISGSNKLPSL